MDSILHPRMRRRRRRRQMMRCLTDLYCIAVLVFSTLLLLAASGYGGSSSFIELPLSDNKLHNIEPFKEFQEQKTINFLLHHIRGSTDNNCRNRGVGIRGRRFLSGPGSSPPKCVSKCGKCTPCKPVHVPVPPETPITAEYYPEAWRCKCGNKLYMP